MQRGASGVVRNVGYRSGEHNVRMPPGGKRNTRARSCRGLRQRPRTRCPGIPLLAVRRIDLASSASGSSSPRCREAVRGRRATRAYEPRATGSRATNPGGATRYAQHRPPACALVEQRAPRSYDRARADDVADEEGSSTTRRRDEIHALSTDETASLDARPLCRTAATSWDPSTSRRDQSRHPHHLQPDAPTCVLLGVADTCCNGRRKHQLRYAGADPRHRHAHVSPA
jgi:hypothetical protein